MNRHTAKEVGERRLAEAGILPLKRLPLPRPAAHPSSYLGTGSVRIHYAQCAKTDDNETRKRAGEALIRSLGSCDISIWTDGSVGTPTEAYSKNQAWPISIKWDERWYTGIASPFTRDHNVLECIASFRSRHRNDPSHVIFYDDGDIHAVVFEQEGEVELAVDEDGDKLICHKINPTAVGAGAYVLHDHRNKQTTCRKIPAGIVCTPFGAEVRAGIAALTTAMEHCCNKSRIHWIVDCQGICLTLAKIGNQDSALISELRERIQDLVKRDASLDIVWVSSHCGIEGNDEVDELARSALNIPLQEQLSIAIDFNDVKAAIRRKQRPLSKDLEELTEEVAEVWTKRTAKVLLNQLYTGCCALFQPLRNILDLGPGSSRHCGKEDTVDHFFKCPGRASRRRKHFKSRTSWRTRILEKPLEVLEYLKGEEKSQ